MKQSKQHEYFMTGIQRTLHNWKMENNIRNYFSYSYRFGVLKLYSPYPNSLTGHDNYRIKMLKKDLAAVGIFVKKIQVVQINHFV